MKDNTFWLKKYQAMQETQKIILETIEEFRHYKQIDKKFINKLNEKLKSKKINARLDTDNFKKLIIFLWIDGHYTESSYYIYEETWDYLKQIISSDKWKNYILEIQEKIDCYNEEVKKISDIITYLKTFDFKNFSYEVRKAIRDLEAGL